MQTWTYRLNHTFDVVLRNGIHGFWRFLVKRDPKPQPTATCYWEVSPNTITLHWKSLDDLNALWDQMVAIHRGIIIPPGYESNISSHSIYVTVRSHNFIGSYFRAMKGAARTRSVGLPASEPSLAKATARLDSGEVPNPLKGEDIQVILAADHQDLIAGMVRSVGPSFRKDSKPLTVSVTPHFTLETLRGVSARTPPTLEVKTSRAKVESAKTGVVVHPVFNRWNNESVERSPQDVFVMFFSAYAYACVNSDEGAVGVGLDFPTFEEADKYHSLHNDKVLHQVQGKPEVAALALLTNLRCPKGRTYNIVAADSVFDLHFANGKEDVNLHNSIQAALVSVDDKDTVREMQSMVLRDLGKKTIKVYDQLARNVKRCQPWYSDLQPMENGSARMSLFPSQRGLLLSIEKEFATEREKRVQTAIRALYGKLYRAYRQRGVDPIRALERTNVDLIHGFYRARTPGALFEVVAKAGRTIGGVTILSVEDLEAFKMLVESDPRSARSILMLACQTYNFPKVEKTENPEKTEKTDDTDDTDNLSEEKIVP